MTKDFNKIMEAVNQGIAASKKSESEFFGVFSKQLKSVADYQATQNGRTAHHTEEIQKLKEVINEGMGRVKGAIWVGGISSGVIFILIGVVSTIAMYAYHQDQNAASQAVSAVAQNLKDYQEKTALDTQAIIKLLSPVIKK